MNELQKEISMDKERKELNRLVFAVVAALEEADVKAYTTTIQKLTYLILALDGKDKEWFKPHLYGPYSENVSCGLYMMVGPYLNVKSELDGKLYSVAPEAGENLSPETQAQISALKEKASSLVNKIKSTNNQDLLVPTNIIKLAKVHWLKKHYPSEEPRCLRERALMMAWDLTIEDTEQSIRHLEKLEVLR